MKFGERSLDDALGTILAHGLRAGERRLKKGTILGRVEIEALREAGHRAAVVAELSSDDVPEDEAAAHLAQAMVGPHMRVSAAFTGRCNLYATADGLLSVDRSLIDAINAIDESLTVATLPDQCVVRTRQMIATVKVIPFAAPKTALESVLAIAKRASESVLRVSAFRPRRAVFIQTRLPGTRETVLDKTTRVMRERLQKLQIEFESEQRCGHDQAELEQALHKILADTPDLVLIAGASAIVDRRDVIPAAIEAVGGEVIRFGMPVDPGNLLLLGRRQHTPVLGLPGCARSPKFNGLDQVLERLAADLPVSFESIANLGVGGLLKETAERNQPRGADTRPVHKPRAPVVAAVLLAAGQSRRMGKANKLLEPLDGRAMLLHVLDALAASSIDRLVVVTGHEADRVSELLVGREVQIVHNPNFADGLSTSLATGIKALASDVDAALVMLGDMPRVATADIERLIAAYDPEEGRSICVPVANGKRGNPVLWDRTFFPEMQQIRGDVGARHLIGEHDDVLCEVEMKDASILLDVDTPDALAALRGAPQGERMDKAAK